MKRVLVAYASNMDATQEIARAIGSELRAAGMDVDVRPVGDVYGVDNYQAVVIGSTLYANRWPRAAVRLLKQHGAELARRRVWLFHAPAGAVSDGTQLALPGNVASLVAKIGAEQVVTFGDELVPAKTDVPTAQVSRFRDWDRIRAWASEVAGEIAGRSTAAS
ncbi:MAG: flavodoxin [Pseudonocardiaceae bacterium]|nr:flavodoxin [Pseudonocardiaceae bacterium]